MIESVLPCYVLIVLGLLTIVGSLTPALWRSMGRSGISGGFSIAQYILAVDVFVIGCILAIHSRTCTCWSSYECTLSTRSHSQNGALELQLIVVSSRLTQEVVEPPN